MPAADYSLSTAWAGPPTLTETMRIEGQDVDLAHLRDLRLYADGPAQRGRDSGNCVPDQQLLPRIRTGGHRGHQHDHEVRHQPISRQRLRLLRQRRSECRRSFQRQRWITGSTTGGDGGKYRPRNRRNDFGGTLGGPVYIPKIYNGHNKTFLFFNYEEFLETTLYSFTDTVPTPAYLSGNFSAISPNGNCSLCAAYGIPTTALGSPDGSTGPHRAT